MSRRFVRSHKARTRFLDALEEGKSVSYAASCAGGTSRNFKAWRDSDADFAKDWEDAEEAGTDLLEDTAVERAKKKSDPLMLAMLKARRPEKFDRGGKLELSGTINVEGSKAKLLNRLAKLKAAAGQIPQAQPEEVQAIPQQQPEVKALPAPSSESLEPDERSVQERVIAGSKRRRASGGSEGRSAAA